MGVKKACILEIGLGPYLECSPDIANKDLGALQEPDLAVSATT